eukprot:gnl/TRDRNA2_/TRDRNA2_41382_c0_seq2.p1 gnl/TRDRNA2_/TRDRNA2_41382_c0~~gnl/TRDRNA2_/TRDRNA2_41382_c0_seq2.p1  ORF type:complete len:285 (-),score=36.60 gnl/TRDRNA2_/TRDRNA2_41382_c0_seq2:81-935(-)
MQEHYSFAVQHVLVVLIAVLSLVVLCTQGRPPKAEGGKGPAGLAALADNAALCALMRSYGASWMILSFFAYAVTLGVGMTIVEHLIFLLFRELNATYFLCGVSVVVTVVFEIPLFQFSKRLLSAFGTSGLLAAAGLCYSFRVVGYTLCPGGWYVLLFEPMHGVTIATFQTASVEMMASITPPAFAATGQAFLGLLRSGVGGTAGNYLGGLIIRLYGESACYRTSAVVVLTGLAGFTAAQYVSSGQQLGSRQLVEQSAAEPAADAEDLSCMPAAEKLGREHRPGV